MTCANTTVMSPQSAIYMCTCMCTYITLLIVGGVVTSDKHHHKQRVAVRVQSIAANRREPWRPRDRRKIPQTPDEPDVRKHHNTWLAQYTIYIIVSEILEFANMRVKDADCESIFEYLSSVFDCHWLCNNCRGIIQVRDTSECVRSLSTQWLVCLIYWHW